jgi:DNA-directed RNA polymerase specialized sigma24 family protein
MGDALVALPALFREVFERHAIRDRSFPEIADTLGITVSDVEYVLATVLVALDRARDGDTEDS